jgi:hypothetical protein
MYRYVMPSDSLAADVKEVLGSLISPPHLHGVSSVLLQVVHPHSIILLFFGTESLSTIQSRAFVLAFMFV